MMREKEDRNINWKRKTSERGHLFLKFLFQMKG